ncbi:MAG: NUDIX hydrolase [bacterium]
MNIDQPKSDRFYRVSVKALITNQNNEILMVKEGTRGWDLPGGGLEAGETPQLALVRELQEELGCDGQVESRPSLITSWRNIKTDYHLLVIIYKVTINDEAVKDTSDVKNTQYFSFDEYVGMLNRPSEADWVSDMGFDYAEAFRELMSQKI